MSRIIIIKKTFIKLIIISGVFLSLISCQKSKKTISEDCIKNHKYSDFIQKVENYLYEDNFQGSVLIGKKNKIIYAQGFGYQDPKSSTLEKNSISTTYEIGSITKQITAAAIMKLVEQGKLNLEDKLSLFYPDYKHGEEINIKMLLNMRSGLTDYINTGDDFFPRKVLNQIEKAQIANRALDDGIVLKYFYTAPLMAKPDSTYFYCNTNYYLLADIIEKITNQSYHEFIQENIFIPCAMSNSNLDFQNTSSKAYDYKGRYYSIPQALSKGCGDINSNVLDLFQWNCNFYNGKVVSKKSFKEMTNYSGYGYGIYCSPDSYFHAGNTNVFNSYLAYYPKEKLSVIVLVNAPVSKISSTIYARNIYKIFKNFNK